MLMPRPLRARLSGALLLAIGLMNWVMPASANVRVSLEARGDSGVFPYPSFYDAQDVQVSGIVSDGGSVAQGFANLDTGILRASTVSVGGGGGATSAESVISESFRFSDGASGTAYLDWSIDGTVSTGSDPFSYGYGGLLFYWVAPDSYTAQQLLYAYTSSDFICDAIQVETSCLVGSSFSASGSIALPILAGEYSLQIALNTAASLNATSDFGNTAHLYLRLPDGVAIDSNSGTFLASATPISAVPEPGTHVLWVAGLGLMVWTARRCGRS